MTVEAQKLELISKITSLQDTYVLSELLLILEKQSFQNTFKRSAGWAKGTFRHIADDFDDFIPPGFENYLPTNEQLIKPFGHELFD